VPVHEVADVFRLHGDDYRVGHKLSIEQHRAMNRIAACRTPALGGHMDRCDACGHEHPSYNSCRDRHCPKCQATAKERWLNDRKAELLPVPYFHVVFTLPHSLNPLILHNRRVTLGDLFEAASQTLHAFAADPRWRLEGMPGIIAVLHTWSRTLIDHFHLHCLVPGGVLKPDGQWKPARAGYLFRVQSMAALFKKLYIRRLEEALAAGKLVVPDVLDFHELMATTGGKQWIVYAKPPFAGPKQVLEYLGRYTHRVAISNERILRIENGSVTFAYKDRQNNTRKQMTLAAAEFIRRFLLHVLPKGFVKIRYFGFLSHRRKKEAIVRIRELLNAADDFAAKTPETVREILLRLTGLDISKCPRCGNGRMFTIRQLPCCAPPDTS
jgi:hypothetical protein